MNSKADGRSREAAVALKARDRWEGAFAEIRWLEKELGNRGEAWEKLGQWLVNHNGLPMDHIRVRLQNGEERDYFFDISAFFGEE